MTARGLSAAGAVLASFIAANAQFGDFNLLVRPSDRIALGGATPAETPSARRGSGKTPTLATKRVIDIVNGQARAFGVPEHIAHYHVTRESGFNPAAKNPRSTAKGTLQVIRGSHAAIIGRNLSLSEHLAMAGDPHHGTRVGMAHIAAAYRANPRWSADRLWRQCHVGGLHNCGASLDQARAIYRGSAPMPSGAFAQVNNPHLHVGG